MNRTWIILGAFFLPSLSGLGASEGENTFLSRIRQITFEGKTGEGYFSPDGKELIFQSVREPGNPFYQIYILNLETGDTHRVSPGIGKTTCAYFQAGTGRVLFASTHLDTEAKKKQEQELAFLASGKTRRYSWDYDASMDIFSAKKDGTDLRRLTDAPGYDAEGAFSPDGNKIVFSSLRNAYPTEKLTPEDRKRFENDPAYYAEVYIMDADGKNQRRLTTTPGYDGGPFFTADGQRIIWRRFEEDGVVANVFSMNLDGSDVKQLTHFKSMSWAPYPHPSGRYFIFTSNKHGFENFELFVSGLAPGTEPVRVTFTDGFDGLPVFSPDGKTISWTSNRGGGLSQLFMADWNHNAALALLSGQPSPSRDTPAKSSARPRVNLSSEILARDAKEHVSILASDAMEGRMTGTKGAQLASEYIAEQLRTAGVQPLNGSYFHEFEFIAGVKTLTNDTRLSVTSEGQSTEFEVNEHFRPLSFSDNGSAEGEVVFAGYGLSVPGKLGEGYNSYEGLDVTNKIVLVLRYVPEQVEAARRQELNRYAGLRYKAMIARERGAKAILVVAGPNSPNAGKLVSLSTDGSLSGSQILAASVSIEVADQLLKASGKPLKEIQSALDVENPHGEKGFAIPKTKAQLAVALEHEKKTDRNVVGLIPPATGNEYVLVGAHYDHLGFGEGSNSREHANEAGGIHNGADDNASGVAVLLELAAHLAANRQSNYSRGIMFAFWSGEELGLLGSSKFAETAPIPMTNIVAYLNFDMVGRLRDNKLTLQGAGSSPIWRKLVEKRNIAAGFSINLQDDPYLPTDVTALYPKSIPVLSFFTGSHDEYHRPTDDTDLVNFEGIEQIAKFAKGLIQDLATNPSRPGYTKVEQSSPGGSRDALRAYLGTIPDYAVEVKGVKLSGVRGGSPAEKAGLKGGDIITEFAGQKIANIYDYTYALDAVKVGQPVEITVTREGKPIKLKVTPEARK